jgi:hypothetical protein
MYIYMHACVHDYVCMFMYLCVYLRMCYVRMYVFGLYFKQHVTLMTVC